MSIYHRHASKTIIKTKKDLLDKNLHFAQKSGPILMNDPQIGTKLSAVFSRFLQFGCLRHTNLGRLTNTSLAFLTNISPACLANTNLIHSYIVISGKRMETNSWECDNCQKVSSDAFWYPKTLDQSIMLTITKITISTPSSCWGPQLSRQATLMIPTGDSPVLRLLLHRGWRQLESHVDERRKSGAGAKVANFFLSTKTFVWQCKNQVEHSVLPIVGNLRGREGNILFEEV